MISSSTGPAGYCRVGRLALLGVDQTQPVDSLDHLGHPNLLDHRLGAPVGMDPDFSLATGCRRTSCSGALDRDIAPAPSGLGECSGVVSDSHGSPLRLPARWAAKDKSGRTVSQGTSLGSAGRQCGT